MTHPFRTALAALILLAPTAFAADSPAVSLKKGDRIVFLGDSITQGGGGAKGTSRSSRKRWTRRTRTSASKSSTPASAATRCPTFSAASKGT